MLKVSLILNEDLRIEGAEVKLSVVEAEPVKKTTSVGDVVLYRDLGKMAMRRTTLVG